MFRFGIVVALLILMHPFTTSAQGTDWAWFRSTSTVNDWGTTDGKAQVVLSAGRFEATLRDSSDPTFVGVTLRGSTSNGVIRAHVRVESTDIGEFDVSGRLRRLCWKTGGGREVIILTDGVDVIGPVRELSESARCTPA